MSTTKPPLFPAGEFVDPGEFTSGEKEELVSELAVFPDRLRQAIVELSDAQLDTKYRNWTIRQIVHHLADSHINCYVRFKWALTEASPMIKSYNETKWSEIVDARTMPVDVSLTILDGIHARWSGMIRELTDIQMRQTFFHTEQMKDVSLNEALPAYVWHGRHHIAQIEWVREQNGW